MPSQIVQSNRFIVFIFTNQLREIAERKILKIVRRDLSRTVSFLDLRKYFVPVNRCLARCRNAQPDAVAGTPHGGCPPDSGVEHEPQAEKAWERMREFFKKALA